MNSCGVIDGFLINKVLYKYVVSCLPVSFLVVNVMQFYSLSCSYSFQTILMNYQKEMTLVDSYYISTQI